MSPSLTEQIKAAARDLGFRKVGVARAEPLPVAAARVEHWLAAGAHGGMTWLAERHAERADIRRYFPAARSVVSVGLNYFTGHSRDTVGAGLNFSNYAWGDDYHTIIRERLQRLLEFVRSRVPGVQGRACVDTSPVLEKAWAGRAGLGWQGKNTVLVTREYGSWLFLGELLLDIELDYDPPFTTDLCGTCTACVDACPTGALTPYRLDVRRCISYLTTTHRGDLPTESTKRLAGWIYGCDICQEVCPWNHKSQQVTTEAAFQPRPEIRTWQRSDWEQLDAAGFERVFHNSAVHHAGLDRLRRNLATGGS